MATRIEKDSMGPLEVPADAYYGVPDQRVAAAAALYPRDGPH
jgi:aspartate ammonia-lyase